MFAKGLLWWPPVLTGLFLGLNALHGESVTPAVNCSVPSARALDPSQASGAIHGIVLRAGTNREGLTTLVVESPDRSQLRISIPPTVEARLPAVASTVEIVNARPVPGVEYGYTLQHKEDLTMLLPSRVPPSSPSLGTHHFELAGRLRVLGPTGSGSLRVSVVDPFEQYLGRGIVVLGQVSRVHQDAACLLRGYKTPEELYVIEEVNTIDVD